MNSSQIRNILAAGTLTGLVMVMFFVFGPGPQQSEAAADTSAMEAIEAQNAELATVVQNYQAREAAFQQQIEAANQTIQQLQSDTNMTQSEYEAALANIQAEGGDLETSLVALQERETEYLGMIETANGTIQDLEASVNGLQTQYQNDVQTLQAQNAELAQIVQLMQQREAQYVSQIELANQTILELQNSAQAGYGGEYEEYEEEEYEEYEDEEYEEEDDD
ncbi:MAG: hypothetical protein AAF614_34075 [Chloroflexota bacterium]